MPNPILVVEDNDDLLVLFKLVLESAGYQVATASNGKEALQSISTIQPQLVLLDIMMPYMDGMEVARTLRRIPDYQFLPILLVSAVDQLQDSQLQDSKANGILYKPFDLDDLIGKVNSLVNDRDRVPALVERVAVCG